MNIVNPFTKLDTAKSLCGSQYIFSNVIVRRWGLEFESKQGEIFIT